MDVAETTVETGLEYTEGELARVRVWQRGRRYDLVDAGVVFVPAVEGGIDRDCLARRVAETSVALYDELLELE